MSAPSAPQRLLEGKVALVTGASRGLGRAICIAFARHGARVAFNYARSVDDAKETLKRIEAEGGKGWPFQVSVLDRVGLGGMVKAIESEWGGIDILVNNAGIGQVLPLALMEEEDWDRMMDTHVKGAFLATQAVMRGMIRRKRGRILNIGSLAGVRMIKAPVHYCAAKAALRGFTEALAKEIGHYGVTVNSIAPGLLDEGVADNVPDERRREYVDFCALGRVGTSAEVAEVCAFVCSDLNSYMNGATVVLDGGL
jgi:NAD(P)-dependent dehydrogenase (short-subunit alcohol dehydrogenase family)